MNLQFGEIVLFAIALFAATVNGGLGYGFSSLTVPVALLFFPNKMLTPSLVLVELAINGWIVVMNRRSLSTVIMRALPIVIGLIPGIVLGSILLSRANSEWLKFATYLVLLPIILMQAAGFRRPIRSERAAGFPLGVGVGTLYATTTISGPPLALMFNNQGLDKEEFRAALGSVRVIETLLTTIAYASLGLFTAQSVRLAGVIAPAVLIGLPLGWYLIRFMQPETFRRICMSFDAWIVGFGLARVLMSLKLASPLDSYVLWAIVIAVDAYLLQQFFFAGRFRPRVVTPQPAAD
jgi:uncharacterized protein